MPSAADIFFAAAPILFLIFVMTKRNNMPSARALPLAAALVYLVRLLWFGTGWNLANATVIAGLLVALTPILIVFSAIFFFRTMEATGAMATIRAWLNSISTNRVAQVVIIGWSFQFLIEGASGFGTPAALAAPLLVGLGHPAVRVAILCLILNSVPVSFGAVGTPTWFGFGQLNLSPAELQLLAWKTALIHSAAALVIPLLGLRVLLSWRELRENALFVYLAIGASAGPMLLLSWFDYEFPAVAGGLVGLVVTVLLARFDIGLKSTAAAEQERVPTGAVVKALFPLWATVLVLLATRMQGVGLRGLLNAAAPAAEVPLGFLGTFAISPALVVQLRGILGEPEVNWIHRVLYVPSLIPFLAISLVSLRLFNAARGTCGAVLRESLARMRGPVPALLGALVFVQLLSVGGETSSAMIIGRGLAAGVGGYWEYLATYLGALGAFFAGSATVSNLTFGPIQDSIATQLHLNRTTILAMQSVGAAMGNMVAIHNIVAVCSVLALTNVEGRILLRTAGPMLLYGLIAALMSLLL